MSAVPRIERLLNLVSLLLKSRGPVSWERDIRGRVVGYDDRIPDLSLWRRFSRDKAELRQLGIEILHAGHGTPEEGYTLDKDRYFLPPVSFDGDEVLLLSLLAAQARGEGGALAGPLSDALDKLRHASPLLPPEMVRGASERYLLRPVLRASPQLSLNLSSLGRALWGRRPVRFRYRAATPGPKAPAERRVEPYALGYRAGAWYLCGRDGSRDDVRLFRLDRIAGKVAFVPGTYGIPDAFRLSDHFGFSPWEMGRGKPMKAVLRVDAGAAWRLEDEVDPAAVRTLPDGTAEVHIPVRNPRGLYPLLVRLGSRVSVRSPAALRRGYRDFLRAVLECHR